MSESPVCVKLGPELEDAVMTEPLWGMGNRRQQGAGGKAVLQTPQEPHPNTQLEVAESTASWKGNKGGEVRFTDEEEGRGNKGLALLQSLCDAS